jgi:arsenite oxidase small subunit
LLCPCHNGCFDAATGRALAGPARRPLTRIALENRDGVVYAVGVEETPA